MNTHIKRGQKAAMLKAAMLKAIGWGFKPHPIVDTVKTVGFYSA
ncbi:hypothetical protein LYNGBM3L_55100 [Moorena producens 3L]|uniref:Uncharacterized protein n=1 Tax=Moorena producens 3L TaxID=489825 RepID=F4XR49_9CYAN|nr:hypothetical protein LYNGBM3L_55100 [Moorena producens 3L]